MRGLRNPATWTLPRVPSITTVGYRQFASSNNARSNQILDSEIEARLNNVIPPTEQKTPEIDELSTKLPRGVQALYLQPLRRVPEYGVPTCDLQLRSFSARPLEFYSDFAVRAAYYLGLPAFGPIPLPRITERWTVPRSSFIFKKSQENFERVTLRRMIQIRDGDPESVQIWLAFLRKHAYYGVGMKANVWEYSKLGIGQDMAKQADAPTQELEDALSKFTQNKKLESVDKVEQLLRQQRQKLTRA